jgi:hypothetical protein
LKNRNENEFPKRLDFLRLLQRPINRNQHYFQIQGESQIHLIGFSVELLVFLNHEALLSRTVSVQLGSLIENNIIKETGQTSRGLKEAVKMINKRSIVEASGGVSLETVREIAKQGVDIISTGYITHHAIWLDLNLEVEEVKDVL